jgi:hypothetical protein
MDERGCARVASMGDMVARLGAARRGGAVVVGIDGRSGSGKTALATRLEAALPRTRVLHLDDVYRGWWGLARGLDHLVTFTLAPLARGEAGRYRPWDWEAASPQGGWRSPHCARGNCCSWRAAGDRRAGGRVGRRGRVVRRTRGGPAGTRHGAR